MNDTKHKERVIVYDIDGMIVDSTQRALKHLDVAAKERGDHEAFEKSVWRFAQTTEGDVPIPDGIRLLEAVKNTYQPDHMLGLTSRGETERDNTVAFLGIHLPWEVRSEDIYMYRERRISDCGNYVYATSSWFDHVEHKRKNIRALKEKYEVIMAFDDHGGVIEMYHQEGIHAVRTLWANIDCMRLFGDKVLLPTNK